ncbi:MAG: transposase [Chloroflexi bacterium]|nr:transposase [Chloroflexota bacterium]
MTERKRRKYTAEFKSEAVGLVIDHGCTIAEAARNLGIHSHMLARWKREYLQKKENALPGTGRQAGEVEELKRLHLPSPLRIPGPADLASAGSQP